jgi:hypothetical protein
MSLRPILNRAFFHMLSGILPASPLFPGRAQHLSVCPIPRLTLHSTLSSTLSKSPSNKSCSNG